MKNKRLPTLPARRTNEPKTPPAVGERFSDAEMNDIRRGIAARIVEIFGENDADIARRCLTTGTTVGKYTRGERIPTGEILLQMRRAAGVNLHWLLTGEGRQFVVGDVKECLTDDETRRITELADESGRDFLEMVIDLALAQAEALKRLAG